MVASRAKFKGHGSDWNWHEIIMIGASRHAIQNARLTIVIFLSIHSQLNKNLPLIENLKNVYLNNFIFIRPVNCLHSTVVVRQSCKLKVSGSIPDEGIFFTFLNFRPLQYKLMSSKTGFLKFNLLLLCIFVLLCGLAFEISRLLPGPFMDEVFHFGQTLQYFRGNWSQWDPMITTPPGLYIVSFLTLRLVSASVCTLSKLRIINCAFGIGTFLVSFRIGRKLKLSFACERALLIVLLPNLFIFHGLFYTDAGSTFFCLLAYLCLIEKWTVAFLLASVASLLFRQTNIIWVGVFFIADKVHREFGSDLSAMWKHKKALVWDVILALCLLFIFASGVAWNGGHIALGDKTSHQVSLHFAQFFYFSLLTCLFCGPIVFFEGCKWSKRHFTSFVLFVSSAVAGLSVHYGTIVHPYVAADNRHWTNLFWRRILRVSLMGSLPVRYLLVPLYGLSIWAMISSLERDALWICGYLTCCALVLVPSSLIEPRYYILPIAVYLLNCKMKSKKAIIFQICSSILINGFIVGMFLYRPFMWPSDPTQLQRRIW
jgi:alpha-1,2-glucosyltransferase